MKTFHIEADMTPTQLGSGRDFKVFFVEAKTYEEACAKVTKHIGEGEWKLLGVYEKMETDSKVKVRVR
jgi:hypothetical protein